MGTPSNPASVVVRAKRYAFVLVPVLGLLELAVHMAQAKTSVPDSDWTAAHDAVRQRIKDEDLLAFAPAWVDPIGRNVFSDVATLEREARPDDTRFPRALEVSLGGSHRAEFEGWPVVEQKRLGALTLTLFKNPAFQRVLDNLVSHLDSARATVTQLGGAHDSGREVACPFTRTHSQSGNIGFGPAVPGDRFVCPQGGFAGVSVVQSLDFLPHRCIFVPPVSQGSVTRLRFRDVAFGAKLRGHHAISWAQERLPELAPVTLIFKVNDRILGKLAHRDGDGWKGFELDTRELEGTRGDLVADVSAPEARDRLYCFEADTR